MVEPLHTAVKGRARYKVEGLFKSETLKTFLELRLRQEKDIVSVSASALTGNVLVSFNSDNTYRTIAAKIEKVLKETTSDAIFKEVKAAAQTDAESPAAEAAAESADGPTSRVSKLRDAIQRLMFPHDEKMNRPWHTLKKADVIEILGTSQTQGLCVDEVEDRLLLYGANKLPRAEGRADWDIIVGQLNSLPVYLLAAAAGVSLLTGGIVDAAVVLGVVIANAAIGYVTESEAEKTIDSLKHLVHPRTEVLRDGQALEIDVEQVVIGDILKLRPGAHVPADARVIKASRLYVDESMLTGESMPVNKKIHLLRHANTPLADRDNMVFMGTQVTGGEGLAVVVSTGSYTQIGRLQALLDETAAPKTPIERQLEKTGDHLVILFLVICALVLLMGFFRGYGFLQMLRMAISLAASAVPEGLPAAATINFAMGITRMKKHRALIRHLQAVETLGAVQTICLDKTGTITRNHMAATRIFADGRRIQVDHGSLTCNGNLIDPKADPIMRHLLMVCALCNETKLNGRNGDGSLDLDGTATEKALIELALNAGLDVSTLRQAYAFEEINHRSDRRLYMSTRHTTPSGGSYLAVKGSPPEVLNLCRWRLDGEKVVPLTDQDRLKTEIENEAMASEALRVLGFACKAWDDAIPPEKDADLIWIGLVGMSDPIRPGVRELIAEFHRAGIETVMITGDQSTTAYAIAEQLNLAGDGTMDILDSAELNALNDPTMIALAKRVKVYSRVSPSDKLKIVQAQQAAGKTVAMTGDGINDGPALKAADIGIAMGKSGTDVAREVADIVLEEDNLETLIVALQDGRSTYRNIRKSVHFFLSTNLSEIMVMFTAMAFGLGIPLTVMQLLWINIISDIFPGIALSMEEPEPDVMDQAPRDADQPLFNNRDYKRMLAESASISLASLAAYGYGVAAYGGGAKASTLAFQSLTVGQLLHALSCRSENLRILGRQKLPPNSWLTASIGGSLLMQLLTVVLPPVRRFLGLAPIGPIDIGVVGASAFAALLINESTQKNGARIAP